MRKEIIQLRSEQEYKEIIEFLRKKGEIVFDKLTFDNEKWCSISWSQSISSEWALQADWSDTAPKPNITFTDFIKKYSLKEENQSLNKNNKQMEKQENLEQQMDNQNQGEVKLPLEFDLERLAKEIDEVFQETQGKYIENSSNILSSYQELLEEKIIGFYYFLQI